MCKTEKLKGRINFLDELSQMKIFPEDHQYNFYVPLGPFHCANLTHKKHHQHD